MERPRRHQVHQLLKVRKEPYIKNNRVTAREKNHFLDKSFTQLAETYSTKIYPNRLSPFLFSTTYQKHFSRSKIHDCHVNVTCSNFFVVSLFCVSTTQQKQALKTSVSQAFVYMRVL